MKILIADDDAYTRTGLVESVDWDAFGIDEIMQAANGQDALKIAAWFHPDIILTDIRMPKMDGLDFASELLKRGRESRVIFISGYMEIDYLKGAIQLSAVDYIEKPINTTALKRALAKAVEEVKKIRRHHAAVEDQRSIRQQALMTLLCGKQSDPKTIEKLSLEIEFPLNAVYTCVFLQYPSRDLPGEADLNRALSSIWTRQVQALGRVDEDKRQIQIIFALRDGRQYQLMPVCAALSEEFPNCWVGIGMEVRDYRHIWRSSRTAAAAVNCAFYQHERRVFRVNEEPQGKKSIDPCSYGEFLQILEDSPEKIQDWFRTLFEELRDNAYCPKEQVCTLMASLLLALYRKYPELYSRDLKICGEEQIQPALEDMESLQEMEHFLWGLLQDKAEQKKYSRIVQGAVSYVAQHFGEKELNVTQIADHLHISNSYLNSLFKQETGITIKQYVSSYRLERSKVLLERDFYKVAEIAELCGYANANYFAKAFRKVVGMTPVEYRSKDENL